MFPHSREPSPLRSGRPISDRALSWLARATAAFARLRPAGQLDGMDHPAAPMLRLPAGSGPRGFIGQLTGTGPAYDLQQYRGDPSNPANLIADPSGISCIACCHEVNGTTGLNGLFADVVWPSNDGANYFFQWLRSGCTHKLRPHVLHDDGTGYEGVSVTITHGTSPVIQDYPTSGGSGATDANGDPLDADGNPLEFVADPTITYTVTFTVTTSWGTCARTLTKKGTLGCAEDINIYVCSGKICLTLTDCTTGEPISGATIASSSGTVPAFTPAGCSLNASGGGISTTTPFISAVTESPAGTYCAIYCAIDRDRPPCTTPLPRTITWTASKTGYVTACGTGSFGCTNDVALTGTMMNLSEETDYVPHIFRDESGATGSPGACCLGCGVPACPTCASSCDEIRSSLILKTLTANLMGTGCVTGMPPDIPITWDGVIPPTGGAWHWASEALNLTADGGPGAGPFQCCGPRGFAGPEIYYQYGQLHFWYGGNPPGVQGIPDPCGAAAAWQLFCNATLTDPDNTCGCPTFYGDQLHPCSPFCCCSPGHIDISHQQSTPCGGPGNGNNSVSIIDHAVAAVCPGDNDPKATGSLCGATPSYRIQGSAYGLQLTV